MLCRQLRRRRPASQDRLMWASRKNIVVTGVPDRGRRYLSDFYTTLIDIQWRWNLLFFVVGFVLTWLMFAIYYYLLCFLHGDLDPHRRRDNSSWTPCVENVNSFTEAYLFSIETMSTIGYGWRYQTEECPGVYLAVMLQSVIGAGLQFALASLVVSKTRRANRFSQTILFSNTAVVYQEDGHLKLAVRIGDMRKGDVIGAHATGMLIKKTTVKEGHRVPVRMFTVKFEAEGGRQKLFLCWPCMLIHCVDQHSPFWTLSRDHLVDSMYELIVILDGVAATTSKPFQARKSYHSWEILWGRRFKPLTINDDDVNSSGYVVNYTTFHHTYPVSTPVCAAQMLERKRLLRQLNAEYEDEDLTEESEREAESPCVRDDDTIDGILSISEFESSEEKLTDDEFAVPCEEERVKMKPTTLVGAKSKPTESETEIVKRKVKPAETEPAKSNQTEPESLNQTQTSQAEAIKPKQTEINSTGTPAKDRVRKISRVEFQPFVIKGTPTQRRLSLGDALNMYRHRRSVTDTYLGTELPEEDSDDSEASAAILSIVSQQSRSPDGKPDVRDVFKVRRKSTSLRLMFGTEGQDGKAHIS